MNYKDYCTHKMKWDKGKIVSINSNLEPTLVNLTWIKISCKHNEDWIIDFTL